MSLNPRMVAARSRSVACFRLAIPATHVLHVCRTIFLVICGVLLIGFVPVGYSQTKAPLTIEDSLKMRIFGEYSPPSISPDSRMVAFVARPAARNSFDMDRVARTGVPGRAEGAGILIVELNTGAERNLTGGKGNSWRPVWSPNGKYLAFLSDRDGSGQARPWVWDAATDELRRVSELNVRGDQVAWLPDSSGILFTILPTNLSVEEYARKFAPAAAPPPKVSDEPLLPTVTLFRAGRKTASEVDSAPWSLDWALRDLALVNFASGTTKIVVEGERLAKYQISPDGSWLAYSLAKRFERPGSQETLFDIVCMGFATGQTSVVVSDVPMGLGGQDFSWSPGGRRLLYRSEDQNGASLHLVEMGSASAQTSGAVSLDASSLRGLSRMPVWDKTGDRLFFSGEGGLWSQSINGQKAKQVAKIPGHRIRQLIATEDMRIWMTGDDTKTIVLTRSDTDNRDGFYEVNLETGQNRKLLEDDECFSCASQMTQAVATRDGKHVLYFAEKVDRESSLWMADADFARVTQLTHLNPQFDKYAMGQAKVIDWMSDDGEPLRGALLLPSDYQPGKKYPLVVWVYGGQLQSEHFNHFGLVFFGVFNMQLLATRGYAVLFPDSPQHEGTPMLDLVKTVLPGVNRVIEMGIADGARLGIAGHSNGGYDVLGMIVQTTRFKAAIDIDGMSDLVGFYTEMNNSGGAFGTSLLERNQNSLGGTLWQYRERYIENSPLFYFDRVSTPLFVVQGTSDASVMPFLGDAAFVALRRLGKIVQYAKYAGEDHSPPYWSYANQLDLCNRMIEWFAHYLLDPAPSGEIGAHPLSEQFQ